MGSVCLLGRILASLNEIRDSLAKQSETKLVESLIPAVLTLFGTLLGTLVGAWLSYLRESSMRRGTLLIQTRSVAFSEVAHGAEEYTVWLHSLRKPADLARQLFPDVSPDEKGLTGPSLELTTMAWLDKGGGFGNLQTDLTQYMGLFPGVYDGNAVASVSASHSAILRDFDTFLHSAGTVGQLVNAVELPLINFGGALTDVPLPPFIVQKIDDQIREISRIRSGIGERTIGDLLPSKKPRIFLRRWWRGRRPSA